MTLFEHGALLFLYAETMSHVGAAESATVDLAIQRNPRTSWPMIQSASLKGALRAAAPSGQAGNYTDRITVFGSDANDKAYGGDTPITGQRTGLLSVGDANLLAMPIASLAGIFGWITCPQAIRDFQRTHNFLTGASESAAEYGDEAAVEDGDEAAEDEVEEFDPFAWEPPTPSVPDAALNARDCRLFTSADRIVLQDIVLSSQEDDGLTYFAAWLARNAQPGPDRLRAKLTRDLLLVHDDIFADLVDAGVHIITRVKIDDESGTVGEGPWDEELLPAEVVLYAPLQARFLNPGTPRVATPGDVIAYVDNQVLGRRRRFQIGAGATIGWGIMAGSVYDLPSSGDAE